MYQASDAAVTCRGPVWRCADQAQINQAAGLDLAVGLRSMMRQDPEVIGVGEIRDLATAEVAFQASLT